MSDFKHGRSGYERHGCRCDICTGANREAKATKRAKARAEARAALLGAGPVKLNAAGKLDTVHWAEYWVAGGELSGHHLEWRAERPEKCGYADSFYRDLETVLRAIPEAAVVTRAWLGEQTGLSERRVREAVNHLLGDERVVRSTGKGRKPGGLRLPYAGGRPELPREEDRRSIVAGRDEDKIYLLAGPDESEVCRCPSWCKLHDVEAA